MAIKINTETTFSGCSSLTSMPTNLFKHCSSLTSMPTDLFRYNKAVSSNQMCQTLIREVIAALTWASITGDYWYITDVKNNGSRTKIDDNKDKY